MIYLKIPKGVLLSYWGGKNGQNNIKGQSPGSVDPLGSELVTNGGFDSKADWSEENGTLIEDGVCKFNTAGAWSILTRQTLTMTEGVTYRVQFDLSDYSSGNIGVALGTLADDSQESINTEGHHSYDLVYQVGATNQIVFVSGAPGSIMNIDNVSVKEVL